MQTSGSGLSAQIKTAKTEEKNKDKREKSSRTQQRARRDVHVHVDVTVTVQVHADVHVAVTVNVNVNVNVTDLTDYMGGGPRPVLCVVVGRGAATCSAGGAARPVDAVRAGTILRPHVDENECGR